MLPSTSIQYASSFGDDARKLTNDPSQEPILFTRIIASISTVDPARLGWDPSLKIYDPLTRKTFASHTPDLSPKLFGQDRYSAIFALNMQNENGQDETFVTVRAMSVVSAKMLFGRATVVWVVKEKELQSATPKVSLPFGST